MEIKIVKPFSEIADFSSERILTVDSKKGFYFWDLDTDKPKIDKKLANQLLKRGFAVLTKQAQ